MRRESFVVGGLLALGLCGVVGCSSGDSTGMKPSSESQSNSQQSQAPPAAGVSLTPEQQRLAGVQTTVAEPRTIVPSLTVPGQIVLDDERTAHVQPYADGKVLRVLRFPGEHVRAGEVLAYMHSHSIHETVGALAQDFANQARQQAALSYAQAKSARYEHLYAIEAASLEQKQGSDQELVQAQTALADAKAAVAMEREHLADLLQVAPASITPATLYSYDELPLKTPMAGTVISRVITPGMVLEPGSEAFTVSDLGYVWMMAAVNQADLPHLRTGEPLEVRTDAWPGEAFPATVTWIGTTLDPSTRTVQVRATVPDPRGRLKPQMFVTATIRERGAQPVKAIFVPEGALQEVNGVSVVFVTADGKQYRPTPVETAPPANGEVQVTSGLRPGDRVAVSGTFMLKSQLLKSTLGSD